MANSLLRKVETRDVNKSNSASRSESYVLRLKPSIFGPPVAIARIRRNSGFAVQLKGTPIWD